MKASVAPVRSQVEAEKKPQRFIARHVVNYHQSVTICTLRNLLNYLLVYLTSSGNLPLFLLPRKVKKDLGADSYQAAFWVRLSLPRLPVFVFSRANRGC